MEMGAVATETNTETGRIAATIRAFRAQLPNGPAPPAWCGTSALCGFLLMFCIPFIACDRSGGRTDSIGRELPSSVTNDAELLIHRCGQPDLDVSTEDDRPRPTTATRMLTYRKTHLRFAFLPGGGARAGDPPPYKWKLLGVQQSRTNAVVSLMTALTKMPCWAGK
jgi:hypothetical protein